MKKILPFMVLMIFVLCTMTSCSEQNTKTEDTKENISSEEVVSEETPEGSSNTGDNGAAVVHDDMNQQKSDDKTEKNSSILVAYFSATGTTKKAAESIADTLKADIYEIEASVPYTEEDIDYNVSDCRANIEQNDSSSRPEISNLPKNLAEYDTILIGYPIWWGVEPKIVDTFAEKYDFTGKTVSVFCTSGGSSVSSSEDSLKSIINADKWISGERIQGSTTEYTDSILKETGW